MYWVVSGFMLVRQRILDIIEDQWNDGVAVPASCWILSWWHLPDG